MIKMLTEHRINQIISESIRLFENDRIFLRLNDNFGYLQQCYASINGLNVTDAHLVTIKQSALYYTEALCWAIQRCIQASSLNENTFWQTMPKSQIYNAIGGLQGSKATNFLSDVGFHVPSAVKSAARGYKNGRDWMEQWGQRYIIARRRKQKEEERRKQQQANSNGQQGQQQQGGQGQQQGGQGQQQASQPTLLSSLSQVNNQTPFPTLHQVWPYLKNEIMMYQDGFDYTFEVTIGNWMQVVDEAFREAGLT